jgi:membrane-associated phospholipid phosphatase
MTATERLAAGLRWLRGSHYMIPAVLVYLAAVSLFLIWRHISVSPDRFVLVLLLLAVILGRWKAFVVDWIPFVALFLGYEFLRGLAGESDLPVHYTEVPTNWLQAHLYHPGQVSWLDLSATVFYFMHFAFPLTLGYGLWLRDRVIFRRFAAALLAMSLSAFVFFLLVPVAPPWLASQTGLLPPVVKIISHTIPSSTSWYYQHLNPDPVAAFPSLHAAFPVLGMLYAVRAFGRAGWLVALWVAAVCFSIVYLGEHYVVDAIAGILLAVLAFVLTEAVWRRMSGRLEAPAAT